MIGDEIKYYRTSRHMTQAELAEKLGLSASTIGMYEQNRRMPDLDIIKQFADLFGLSVDVLIGNKKTGGTAYDCDNHLYDGESIAIIFGRLLKSRKLTIEMLSEKTGIPEDILHGYDNGTRQPVADDLIRLSQVFDVSIDYLLNNSQREKLSTEEEYLLQSFERCDDECKQYLIAKAGVLCVEGISAVAAAEYGKYVDSQRKSYPSSGTEGRRENKHALPL